MADKRREIEKELNHQLGMLMSAVFWLNHLLMEYTDHFGEKPNTTMHQTVFPLLRKKSKV